MVSGAALCCLLGGLLVAQAWPSPAALQPIQSESPHPLTLVSDLTSRLGAHPSRLPLAQDARLSLPPLPSSQDLEAIKKVAQILVMLGQQVIPAIIGEPAPAPPSFEPATGGDEVPNDPVNVDDRQS